MARSTKLRQRTDDDGPRKKSTTAASNASRRITRLMTTDASRKAVFQTAELLENIFLCLPPKSVIGAQRTCRQFRDIVVKSIKIQQHVFLRPVSNDLPWCQLGSVYPFRIIKVGDPDTKLETGGYRATPVVLHPLMRCDHMEFMGSNDGREVVTPHQQSSFTLAENFQEDYSGSWRKMYLTDTPATTAAIVVEWQIGSAIEGRVYHTVKNASGLTFGELVDAAMYRRCSASDYYFEKCGNKFLLRELENRDLHMKDVVKELAEKHERRARWTEATIYLKDVIVPTAREWEQIRNASV